MTYCTPSDHFPIFTTLSVGRTPPPLPTFLSFRRLHSIDVDSFISDIQSSRLITNHPTSLSSLLISYNTTLSSLLDKHAPIISKLSKHRTKPNPWFTPTLHAFRSKVRHAETVYTNTLILLSLGYHSTSLRNRYHNLILIAKKKFYSNLVLSSTNPRRLWQTVNKLLHRKSTSPLPTSSSSVPLPDRFASFFTDEIFKLHLTLSSHLAMASPHYPSPLASPPDFSTFRPASKSEVSKTL